MLPIHKATNITAFTKKMTVEITPNPGNWYGNWCNKIATMPVPIVGPNHLPNISTHSTWTGNKRKKGRYAGVRFLIRPLMPLYSSGSSIFVEGSTMVRDERCRAWRHRGKFMRKCPLARRYLIRQQMAGKIIRHNFGSAPNAKEPLINHKIFVSPNFLLTSWSMFHLPPLFFLHQSSTFVISRLRTVKFLSAR